MFHLQPGTGVGFSGSREIALGLGLQTVAVVEPDFTPEPVHPPGMGRVDRRQQILEEDELLLSVIMAFLQIKDD